MAGAPTDPQTLATALRDLAVAADLFEQTPSNKNRQRLRRVGDYVEMLLDQFVASEVDIFPRYLAGIDAGLLLNPSREHA